MLQRYSSNKVCIERVVENIGRRKVIGYVCKTIREVDDWWIEFEKSLFSVIDHMIIKQGIDTLECEREIHELKTKIGDQLIIENNKLTDLFLYEYEENLSVNGIKQFFFKKYEYYMELTNESVGLMVKKRKIEKLKIIASKELEQKGYKRDSYYEEFKGCVGIGCYAVPKDKPYYMMDDSNVPKDGNDYSKWFEWDESDL